MTNSIRKIALTGGIASGKSLAGDYLQTRGIPVIDADAIVHQLLQDDPDLKAHIRAEFGTEVFSPDGTVDRKALGHSVFADDIKRKLLESWIHPKVRVAIEAFYQAHADQRIGVALIPLLFESNLEHLYDEIWLVETSEAHQLARLMEKRAMQETDAQARIRSQMPFEEKRRRAEQHPAYHIIQNTGTSEDLYQELNRILVDNSSS